MFFESVETITEKLKADINQVKFGHFENCTSKRIVTPINGKNDSYLCKTCISHMKHKRLPPMSVKNNLQLVHQDESIKLTDLEGDMIAKNIIFQKIHQLPKSRWTSLTDKIVNVPINDSDIIKTVDRLPRTPMEAQLIGVSLKRKKEFKNYHKRQLVNPWKIIKMLELLKISGNPYYQFYDSYENFKQRCQKNDPEGYNLLFLDDIEEDLQEKIEKSNNFENDDIIMKNHSSKSSQIEILESNEETEEDLEEELDYVMNDPVRKYQFTYNESLCLTQKYPELEVQDHTKDIEIAPGEGKRPRDLTQEYDWDIKAFPHLHNPNGSNGLDAERSSRLTNQNYFIQRILNLDQRFAKSAAYKFAAVAFIEKKQLQRNISIAGTRGKKVHYDEGNVTYELEDAYTVLDDIRNTPRYWKKVKHEMIAKLENLGAFQIFFTLSCADLRWEENFAAILRDKSLNVIYSVIPDENGYHFTKFEVEFIKEGKLQRKDLKEFINDELDISLHELIRGNVLLATRYFNQRVKKFINTIVMGPNNPMCGEHFTYKVEFQERGAGHVHGTLWLDLKKLEKLSKKKQMDN